MAATTSDDQALATADRELRDAARAMRAALAHFGDAEHEAMRAYAHNVKRALAQLEEELDVSATELATVRAHSEAEMAESLSKAKASWSALTEDMRLQAHLGEMEVRDLYRRADEDLHQAGAIISSNLDSIGRAGGHELEVVRAQASKAIGKLRSAMFGLRLAGSRTEEA